MVRDQEHKAKTMRSLGHCEPQGYGMITLNIIIFLTIVVCAVVVVLLVVIVAHCARNPNRPTPDRPRTEPLPPSPASCNPTPPAALTTPRPVPSNPLLPPKRRNFAAPPRHPTHGPTGNLPSASG